MLAFLLSVFLLLSVSALQAEQPSSATPGSGPSETASTNPAESEKEERPAGETSEKSGNSEESEKTEKPAEPASPAKPEGGNNAPEDGNSDAERQKELNLLKQQMLFAPSTERRQAIHQVERLKKESEQEFFLETLRKLALEDMDPLVREASIRLLADIKDKGSADVFQKALDDDMRPVMREALRGLGRIEQKSSAQRIFELLQEEEFKENDNVTVGMIRTLADLESKIAADFLAGIYAKDDTNLEIQRAILLYYGNAKVEGRKDWLTEILKDKNEDIIARSYAANALGKIKSPDSVEPLKDVLEEIRNLRSSRERARHNPLKQQAILALIRLDDKSILPELKAAALDDDASVRLRAVKQIGQLKIQEFRDMLEYKAKHEPSRSVKKAAQEALDILDGKAEAEGDEDTAPAEAEKE